jgi:3-deoxy-D-manno-octulosonic-acid transferase
LWGEAIEIARDLDETALEAARRLIEDRLNALTREADRRAMPRRGRSLVRLYPALSSLLAPLVLAYLRRRVARGKEDEARLGERHGVAGLARPSGPLIWIHAASIGEATAVLGLIERLLTEHPRLEILVTSGTVTSAALLAERLPARARHQYAPVDLPGAVARFLDYWRPDMALWVESELWPNLVFATAARRIPMLLLNGRLSDRSYAGWHRWPGFIAPLLGAFELCLVQDDEQAARFSALGAREVAAVGDLKAAAAPLPADPTALAALRRDIGARPLWLASSTHAGEEEIAAAVHERLAPRFPGLLTIIAPRHPRRGPEIAQLLARRGLGAARRAAGERVGVDTEVYLADTLGELGLFYRLAGIAFIGGSLAGKGGHNPFEAARLGCAVLYGPDTRNCARLAAALAAAGAAETVRDADALAEAVAALLADPMLRRARATAGVRAAEGEGVLDETLRRLAPWTERLACGGEAAPQAERRRA